MLAKFNVVFYVCTVLIFFFIRPPLLHPRKEINSNLFLKTYPYQPFNLPYDLMVDLFSHPGSFEIVICTCCTSMISWSYIACNVYI